MDLQMANGRHLLIGLDLLMGNVNPAPSAQNNFANNESALHITRKLWLQKSIHIICCSFQVR